MKMKKLLCSLVAGAAVLTLAACSGGGSSNKAASSGDNPGKTEITGGHSRSSPRKCSGEIEKYSAD